MILFSINLCQSPRWNRASAFRDVCSNQFPSVYLFKNSKIGFSNGSVFLILKIRIIIFADDRDPNTTFRSSEPNKCYRVIEEDVFDGQYNHFIYKFNDTSKEWVENSRGWGGGGIYSEPLPRHNEFYQSSRVAIGDLCGQPLRFPDAVLVFQNYSM